MLHMGRGNKARTIGVLMLTIAGVSAFMNNTPVAVIFLPVVLAVAVRLQIAPSKLLIPLSYATILGGTCTLIGTSTNLLVGQAVVKAGLPPLHLFDFAIPGVIYALSGLAFLAVAGPYLLPVRASVTGAVSGTRVQEFVTEIQFPDGSALVGRSYHEVVGKTAGLVPLMVIRGEETYPAPLIANPRTQFIRAGDVLLLKGQPGAINQLLTRGGVTLPPELGAALAGQAKGKTMTMVELVVNPNSPLIGRTLGGADFSRPARQRLGHRHPAPRRAPARARGGDPAAHGRHAAVRVRRVAPRRPAQHVRVHHAGGRRAARGAARQGAAGHRHPGGGRAAGGLRRAGDVLHGRGRRGGHGGHGLPAAAPGLPVHRQPRSSCSSRARWPWARPWTSPARSAGWPARSPACSGTTGRASCWAGLFLIAAVINALISNNAVAVLFTPLGIQIAHQLHVSPAPFIFGLLFAASCDFSTPIGYQTNLFVYGPGGYRFSDYMRVGVPLTLVLFVVSMILVPFFWPFVTVPG
jgi:di/tricarboxylate transporter